ncbi:hypothetical protein RKD37_007839 [Streptomyces ambofaciens]
MPVHYDDAHIRELGQLWISTGEMLQEAVGVMDGAVSSMAGGWTGKAGHAAEVVWNGVADHNIRHALLEAGTVAVEIGQAIINYADELQKAIDEINRAALIGALTTIFGMVLGVASFGIGAVLARLTSLVGQLVQSIASSISRIAAAAANVGRAAAFTADSVLNAGVTLGTDLFAGWLGSKAGHGPMHIDWESEGVNMGLGVWTGWGMGGVDILKGPNTAAGGKGLPNIATPGPAPSPSKASSLSVPHAGNSVPNIGLPHVGDLAPFPNSVVQTNHAPPTGAGVANPVTAAPGPNAGAPGTTTPLPGTVRPGQERPGTRTPGTARPNSPVPHPLPTLSAGRTADGGVPPHTVRPGQVHPEGTSPALSGPTAPSAVRPGEVHTGGSTPAASAPNTPVTPRPGNQVPHTAGNDISTGNGTPPAAVRSGPSTPRTPQAFLDGPRSAGLPDAPALSPSPHGGAGAVRETTPAGPGAVPRTNSPRGEQNTPTATSHAPVSEETTPRNTVTSHAGNPQVPLAEGAAGAGAGRATTPTPHGTPASGTGERSAQGTPVRTAESVTTPAAPVRRPDSTSSSASETPAAAHHEAGARTTANDGPQGTPHRGARPVEPGHGATAVPARPDRAAPDTRGTQTPHTPAPDGGTTPEQQWHTYRQEQNERTLPVVEAEARLEFRGEELTDSWNRAYDTFTDNNVFGGTRIARDGHQMRNAHWQWRHDITQQFRAEVESTGRVSSEAFDRIVHDAKASAHNYIVRADQKERFAAVVKERIDSYKANRFGDGELLPDFPYAPTKSVFDADLNRFVKDDSKRYGHPGDGTAAPGDPFRDRSHDYNVLEQYYLTKEVRLDGILDRYLPHGETGGELPARTRREIDTLVEGVFDDIGAIASRERDIRTATGEQFDDVVRWNSRGRDALPEDFVAKVRQDFEYDLRTDHELVFRHGDGDGARALWDLRASRAIDELPGRIAREHFVRARVAEETAFAQNHLSELGEDFLGRFGEGGRERVVAEYLDAVRATAQRHFDEEPDSLAKAGETAAEWSGVRDALRTSLPDRVRYEGDLQAVVGEAAHAFHEIAGHPGSIEAFPLHEDTLGRLGNDFRTERVTRYDELFAPQGHRTSAWLSHESRAEDGFQARLGDLRDGDFVPELRSWSYPAFRDWRAASAPSGEGHPAARSGTPDRPVSMDGDAAPGHRTSTPAHDTASEAPSPATEAPAPVRTRAEAQAPPRTRIEPPTRTDAAPQPLITRDQAAPTQVSLERDAAGAPGTAVRTPDTSAHTSERQHRAQQPAQALRQDEPRPLDESFGRPTGAPHHPVPSVDTTELAETVRGLLAERGIEDLPSGRLDRAHEDLLNVGILTPRSTLAERAAVVADFVTESERLTEAVNDELGARAGRPVSYEEVGDAAWQLASETGEAFTSLSVPAQVEAIADHILGTPRQDRAETMAARTVDKGKAVDRGRDADPRERPEEPVDGFDQDRALRELQAQDPLLRDLSPGELRDAFRIQEHTDPAVAGAERLTRLHHLGRIGRELHLHGAEAAWDLAGRLAEHGDRTGLFGGSSEPAATTTAGQSADPSGATQGRRAGALRTSGGAPERRPQVVPRNARAVPGHEDRSRDTHPGSGAEGPGRLHQRPVDSAGPRGAPARAPLRTVAAGRGHRGEGGVRAGPGGRVVRRALWHRPLLLPRGHGPARPATRGRVRERRLRALSDARLGGLRGQRRSRGRPGTSRPVGPPPGPDADDERLRLRRHALDAGGPDHGVALPVPGHQDAGPGGVPQGAAADGLVRRGRVLRRRRGRGALRGRQRDGVRQGRLGVRQPGDPHGGDGHHDDPGPRPQPRGAHRTGSRADVHEDRLPEPGPQRTARLGPAAGAAQHRGRATPGPGHADAARTARPYRRAHPGRDRPARHAHDLRRTARPRGHVLERAGRAEGRPGGAGRARRRRGRLVGHHGEDQGGGHDATRPRRTDGRPVRQPTRPGLDRAVARRVGPGAPADDGRVLPAQGAHRAEQRPVHCEHRDQPRPGRQAAGHGGEDRLRPRDLGARADRARDRPAGPGAGLHRPTGAGRPVRGGARRPAPHRRGGIPRQDSPGEGPQAGREVPPAGPWHPRRSGHAPAGRLDQGPA